MKNQEDWEKAECCGEKMMVEGGFGEGYVCRRCWKRENRVAVLELMVLEAHAEWKGAIE